MAKKTSVKNKDILKGTNAADVLTVKHSQVTVNAGKGNDKINVNSGSKHRIYGEAGNDTIIVAAKAGSGSKIYGDDAKNKLTGKDTFTINGGKKNYFYGGKGTDTFNVNGGSTNYIYGGEGNDVIVIGKNSTGTAIVKDFNVKSGNTDKLKVTGGTVKSVTLSGKNLIVKGGKSASVTLENAAGKTISLQDSRGSYTASKTEIKLGSSFTGTMDATKYLSTVTKIDGRNATKRVNITGNAQDNIIYAGKSGGTIKGGAGDDTLYGGAGADTFVHNSGNDTIYNYVSGSDTIKLATTTLTNSALSGNDAVLNLTNGERITVKNAVDRNIVLIDSAGTSQTVKVPIGGTNTGGNTGGGTGGNTGGSTGTSETVNEIVITKGGTYKATSKKDLFNIQTNDTITITNIASNDIIKVLNYNAYSMKQIGNDLIINNSVIVKDYYKLSGSIKFGDKALTLIPGTDGKSVLNGTSGNDIIFGNAATKSVYAYDGNDEIIAGHNQIVFAGNGNDTIISDEPGTNVLYGGNGDDSFMVSSSGKNYMYGGNDDDTIVVSGSGSYYMYGGEGNDTLKSTSISGSYYMYGGNGKDTYIPYLGNIYSKSYSGGSIIIKNAETTFTDEEFANLEDEAGNGYNSYKNINSDREDTLVINNYNIEDFTFKLDKFDLIISSKYDVYSTNSKAYANELIRIKDWYVHPLENIQFKDKTYTADEINNYMASTYYRWVDDSGTYEAMGDNIRDVFLVDPLLESKEIILSEFGESDILDLSFGNGYTYMVQSGNDLKIIPYDREYHETNAITINNFFKNANQDNYILTSSKKQKLIEAYNNNVQARAKDGWYYVYYDKFVYAGDGNDTIKIYLDYETPKEICGEGGDDIITLVDWEKYNWQEERNLSDIYLNGGSGNDTFIMDTTYGIYFFNSPNAIYIDERGKTSNEVDTLEIRYGESKDFKFSLDDSGNLIIAEKDYEDSHACYHILGGNVLDSIYFTQDKVTYTKEDIANKLGLNSISSAMLTFSDNSVSSSANIGNDLFQQNNSSNIIVTGNV